MTPRVLLLGSVLLTACAGMPAVLPESERDPLLWIDEAAESSWRDALRRHPRLRNEPIDIVTATPNVLARELARGLATALAIEAGSAVLRDARQPCPTVVLEVAARALPQGRVAVRIRPLDIDGSRITVLEALSWEGRVSIPDYRRANATVASAGSAASTCSAPGSTNRRLVHADTSS